MPDNSAAFPPPFARIVSLDDARVPAFAEIFDVSFPFEERRERDDWRGAFRDPLCEARIYGDDENSARAILVVWNFGHCRYVEYFATAPRERGNGLGGKILDAFVAEAPGVPVVLEIEPPEDTLTRRRLGFYERHGFVRNAGAHFHPPYHAGFSRQRLIPLNSGNAPLSPDARERFVHDLETVAMAYAPH